MGAARRGRRIFSDLALGLYGDGSELVDVCVSHPGS